VHSISSSLGQLCGGGSRTAQAGLNKLVQPLLWTSFNQSSQKVGSCRRPTADCVILAGCSVPGHHYSSVVFSVGVRGCSVCCMQLHTLAPPASCEGPEVLLGQTVGWLSEIVWFSPRQNPILVCIQESVLRQHEHQKRQAPHRNSTGC